MANGDAVPVASQILGGELISRYPNEHIHINVSKEFWFSLQVPTEDAQSSLQTQRSGSTGYMKRTLMFCAVMRWYDPAVAPRHTQEHLLCISNVRTFDVEVLMLSLILGKTLATSWPGEKPGPQPASTSLVLPSPTSPDQPFVNGRLAPHRRTQVLLALSYFFYLLVRGSTSLFASFQSAHHLDSLSLR